MTFYHIIQDVAATKARNLHARGLLNIEDGDTVIASRFELPEFKEVDEEMTPSQITDHRDPITDQQCIPITGCVECSKITLGYMTI